MGKPLTDGATISDPARACITAEYNQKGHNYKYAVTCSICVNRVYYK